jgi:lysozyme
MIETDNLFIARLVAHEGLRLKPYRDTAGKLTIGVGRNLDDVGLTRTEALFLLGNDIAAARGALDHRWPWWRTLDPVRRDALTELVFNLGVGGLSAFKQFLSLLQSGAFEAAASDLLETPWAGQVGDRAQSLAVLLRTGQPT